MRHTMTGAITAGSILIEEGTHLPNSLLLQSESCSNGWASVKNARSTLEKEIQEAGWTFFFMAGEIRSTVFGFDKQKTLRAALKRLIANVKSHNCNSIEITQVTGDSFLKVPYVNKTNNHISQLQQYRDYAGDGRFVPQSALRECLGSPAASSERPGLLRPSVVWSDPAHFSDRKSNWRLTAL